MYDGTHTGKDDGVLQARLVQDSTVVRFWSANRFKLDVVGIRNLNSDVLTRNPNSTPAKSENRE